jgi:hypothetical protein
LSEHRSRFRHIEESLAKFDVELGFACSFNALFQLSPTAIQYQENLFTELLPTLRDRHNLVLTVYVRTGFTDVAAIAEEKGKTVADENTQQRILQAKFPIMCAQQLEQEFLQEGDFRRVVWMLVTDSQSVKSYVKDEYHDQTIKTATNKATPRIVLTTGSSGKHSRLARDPSTADFAESMIDWYLIGESDAVVINHRGYTFPTTGALRTNRTVYSSDKFGCSKMSRLFEE